MMIVNRYVISYFNSNYFIVTFHYNSRQPCMISALERENSFCVIKSRYISKSVFAQLFDLGLKFVYSFIISRCWVVRTESYPCISAYERELLHYVNLGGIYIKQSISGFIFRFSVKRSVQAHNLKVLRVTQRKLAVYKCA